VLHTQTWGKGDPVVLLHGFTQSGDAWGPLAGRLATGHRVITVDLPGHGGSATVEADLPDGADLIAEAGAAAFAEDGGPDSAAWIGYSLGGRFALHLALARPELVGRLVVVSATGGIDDPAERAERRSADELVARRIERDGVAEFVRWWLDRPLFATLPLEAAAVESRLEGTTAGWASSLRRAGAGTQEPLWDRLASLTMPVLVVAGALDGAYVERAQRLVTAIGTNARLAVIEGAGHACHLEAPDAWLAAVDPFLAGGFTPATTPGEQL
jgi:2-succinyl-6-hydroxy-2,4-cyclohexadiene-1-carboxylate synthase